MKTLIKEATSSRYAASASSDEVIALGRAALNIKHFRDGELLSEDNALNLITNAGRDFLHIQGYGTTGLGANGFNYIALSNDALTETTASTVLSNEIVSNGLSRTQGTVSHTTGTNTTTIQKTFTATGSQQCQKAALFTASSSGTMNHVLAFTQRSLISGDTIQITFSITLG